MTFENELLATPPHEWQTQLAIVLDWYDGPREGIASLESPKCEFYFQLLAERPTEADLDDRLFQISELPSGTLTAVLAVLRTLGQPANAVWVPTWRFESDDARRAAENKLDELLAKRRATDLVVWTRDMTEFLGCWHAARNGTPDSWFATLGIPK
jgi:hypothetical protein